MSDDDWFSDDAWAEDAQARSEARRADPVGCVAELVRDVFEHNTEEEARALIEHRVASSVTFGADMHACLSRLLSDPPSAIGELLRERAGLYLYRDNDGDPRPYDDAETLDWLRALAADIAKMLEQAEKDGT